jgi:hypothetical protein
MPCSYCKQLQLGKRPSPYCAHSVKPASDVQLSLGATADANQELYGYEIDLFSRVADRLNVSYSVEVSGSEAGAVGYAAGRGLGCGVVVCGVGGGGGGAGAGRCIRDRPFPR